MELTEYERIGALPSAVESLLRYVAAYLHEIDEQYAHLPRTDTRRAALHKLANSLTPAHMSVLFLSEQLLDPSWWTLPGRAVYVPESLPIAIDQFERSAKFALLMSAFSATESTFRSIADAVTSSTARRHIAFKSVYGHLFARLESDSQFAVTFDFFRLLRNSCHNNSVHNGADVTLVRRGVSYTFRDKHVVSFLTWEVLLELIGDVCGITRVIVLNPDIAAIATVTDPYARGQQS